jgi:ferredoxin-NADP reductase
VAGTALHGRLTWHAAEVVARRMETNTACTLVLRVPDWPGHDAGQHVDVRLTADDGYTAVRSYSIASPPMQEQIELTIELMPDGEVSPYLVQTIAPGDPLEVLGPIGGWFVWKPDVPDPTQLIAGGSGIVPLMSMIRSRKKAASAVPFRLIYSVRSPQVLYYADELQELSSEPGGLALTVVYTRTAPENSGIRPQRIDARIVEANAFPVAQNPEAYVCGPTSFVEAVSDLLTAAGYDSKRVRTERFGPTGAG